MTDRDQKCSRSKQEHTVSLFFQLPFRLRLSGGIYFAAWTTTGDFARVGFSVPTPDGLGSIVVEQGGTMGIYAHRGNAQIVDPSGRCFGQEWHQTIAEYNFGADRPAMDIELDPDDPPLAEAIQAVNAIIKVYVDHTGETYNCGHIHTISYKDIRGGVLVKDAESQKCIWLPEVVDTGTVSDREMKTLIERVANAQFPSIHRELMMEARSQCRQERFRVAAISLASAIEVFVDTFLQGKCNDYIVKSDGPYYKGKRMNAFERFRKALRYVLGVCLETDNADLWHNYERIVFLRNAAAHRGVLTYDDPVSKLKVTVNSVAKMEELIESGDAVMTWVESKSGQEQGKRVTHIPRGQGKKSPSAKPSDGFV
ncbi:MAG: hypothetical protein AB1696_25530 [Planctomycetota bacterium]